MKTLLVVLVVFLVGAEVGPASAQDSLGRGRAHFEAGRFEAALKEFDRAVLESPRIEPSLWQRGICQYYAGRYDAGIRGRGMCKALEHHL